MRVSSIYVTRLTPTKGTIDRRFVSENTRSQFPENCPTVEWPSLGLETYGPFIESDQGDYVSTLLHSNQTIVTYVNRIEPLSTSSQPVRRRATLLLGQVWSTYSCRRPWLVLRVKDVPKRIFKQNGSFCGKSGQTWRIIRRWSSKISNRGIIWTSTSGISKEWVGSSTAQSRPKVCMITESIHRC
jgi:hypothetical protein